MVNGNLSLKAITSTVGQIRLVCNGIWHNSYNTLKQKCLIAICECNKYIKCTGIAQTA